VNPHTRSVLFATWVALAGACSGTSEEGGAPSPFEHELFVVSSGDPGHSYRIRLAEGRAPQVLAAATTAFYDGTSLLRFQRMELSRSVPLEGDGAYEETRVRLTEEDGLGSGRWIHEHGLFIPPPSGHQGVTLVERSGKDLVAVVGTLRGVRVWSEGTAPLRSYQIHDRFGDPQDLLQLYGPQHRDLIAAARLQWDAIPQQQRDGYRFDYKSSYLQPAPGGLLWVMHGTAADPSRHGTTLPVEVPAPPPLFGGIDPTSYGEPGDAFRFGSLQVEAGAGVRVQGHGWSLDLPGGGVDDPPLVAIHYMATGDIPEAHVAALDQVFSEDLELALLDAAPSP